MERMVNLRLTWTLETSGLLSPQQYGFRKFRSSMDHLASLETDIRWALHRREHLVLISLDLSNAFDKTSSKLILEQLESMDFTGALPNFIRNFLSTRFFQVRANGQLSDTYSASLGVPQGSVLSPTLFNLGIKSMTSVIPSQVKYKFFADDIIIYYSSQSSRDITSVLNKTLLALGNWTTKYGYSFSPLKSTQIHFCRHRTCPRINPISINGLPIPMVNAHNILGLTFDHKLNWDKHINLLKTRTSQDLNLMRSLSSTKWGSDFTTLNHIYKSLIFSKLSYGDFIYDSASANTKKKLNPIQNQAIRLATGSFRTSPIPSLQCISSTPPLYLTRQQSLLNFYSSHLYRFASKSSLDFHNIPRRDERFYPPNSIPLRIKHNLASLNLTPPSFDYPTFTSFPPWRSPKPLIDLSLSYFSKSSSSNSTLHSLSLERINKYSSDFSIIYSDGSKSQLGVGAAFVHDDSISTFKFPLHSTIFSAELLAIKESLRYAIKAGPNKKYLIVSDSLSAMESLKNGNPKFAYLNQITDLLYIANHRNIKVAFLWIPSHIGIRGNDRADQYAKKAVLQGSPISGENHPKDYQNHIKCIYRDLFQLQWDLEESSNKLWEIKPLVYPPFHKHSFSRKQNTIWRRLAIGHSYLTHSYLIKNENVPTCTICQSTLTIKHIFESPHSSQIRGRFKLQHDLKKILDPNKISIHIDQIIEYLKAKDYYRLI